MKKYLIYTFLILAGCSSAAQEFASAEPDGRGFEYVPEGIERMGDIFFQHGMALSPLSSAIVTQGGGFAKTNVDTLRFGVAGIAPTWQIAQWNSRHDLGKTPPVKGEDGTISYSNAGKNITRFKDGTLRLEVFAGNEYDHPRVNGEDWPHLLIKQSFDPWIKLAGLEKLNYGIEVRMVHCENLMGSDYQSNLHTAHAPFYFYIRNATVDSPDYNVAIWFGIATFDYRTPELRDEEKISWDLGTSQFIYQVPQTQIWGDISFHDGQWHSVRTDILPMVQQAVEAMHTKDVFLHTTLEDLEISGMNFGWEVPGTFDAGLEVRNISLKTVKQK